MLKEGVGAGRWRGRVAAVVRPGRCGWVGSRGDVVQGEHGGVRVEVVKQARDPAGHVDWVEHAEVGAEQLRVVEVVRAEEEGPRHVSGAHVGLRTAVPDAEPWAPPP